MTKDQLSEKLDHLDPGATLTVPEEVLAHMFGDEIEAEPDEPAPIVQGRIVDRFLQ